MCWQALRASAQSLRANAAIGTSVRPRGFAMLEKLCRRMWGVHRQRFYFGCRLLCVSLMRPSTSNEFNRAAHLSSVDSALTAAAALSLMYLMPFDP